MVRLADLPEWERDNHLNRVSTLTRFTGRPWVKGKALSQRRVALITTAGLHINRIRVLFVCIQRRCPC